MIDDALTNPPMPDWNELRNEDRKRIMDEGEYYACSCCSPHAPAHIYDVIRDALKEREKRVFQATMAA